MNLNLKYLFSFLSLFVLVQLRAQVQFEMSVSAKEIGRKDEVQVEYVISGAEKISGFQAPYFDKWTVMSGPSNSTEIYTVNGKKSSTWKYIYILSPMSTGRLNLPGSSVSADGKNVSCKGITVTVKRQDHVDGAGPAPSYAPPQVDLSPGEGAYTEDFKEYELRPGEDAIKKIRNNLFIKAIPGKARCYVGEPVLVTYKLYTRLKSTSRVMKQPAFTGCSVTEMTTADMRAVVETVNGKKYNTYIFRRVQLFPLQAGRVTATPATVDNTVTFIPGGSDPRKMYYGIEGGEDYDLSLSTEPFSIEVLPLPGNQTATVGNFEVFTRLKKDTIAANETNALIVTIAGSGNFKSITEPEIHWPENLYHFDAAETDELDKLSFPITGRKTYEIPFEVSKAGKINFAPVSLSYFDPSKAGFKTVQSRPLQLVVTPANKAVLHEPVPATEAGGARISYLLYALVLIFLSGAVLLWKRSGKKPVPVVATSAIEMPKEKPAPHYNVKDKLDELIFLQDDMAFYSKARELAKDLIGVGKGDHDLLLQVLQDCNTVLYTPIPSTSRKEILEKLKNAIG
jgi:hypothetical protein